MVPSVPYVREPIVLTYTNVVGLCSCGGCLNTPHYVYSSIVPLLYSGTVNWEPIE